MHVNHEMASSLISVNDISTLSRIQGSIPDLELPGGRIGMQNTR